jgi:NAD(P)-dependent dehydrogenase (short-subunit alcohol dehydrogenase family)
MGEASAKLFAKEGAKVVVAEINAEAGRKVAQQIKQEGGEAIFVQVDVSKADDVKRMVQTLSLAGVSCLIMRIAGRIFGSPPPPGKTQEEVELEDWRQVIDVNLMGPFIACLYAIPVMRKQGGGCILNTASTGALRAQPRSIAYATSKGGLVLTTKSLARAVVKDNIRVNAICPALVIPDWRMRL